MVRTRVKVNPEQLRVQWQAKKRNRSSWIKMERPLSHETVLQEPVFVMEEEWRRATTKHHAKQRDAFSEGTVMCEKGTLRKTEFSISCQQIRDMAGVKIRRQVSRKLGNMSRKKLWINTMVQQCHKSRLTLYHTANTDAHDHSYRNNHAAQIT